MMLPANVRCPTPGPNLRVPRRVLSPIQIMGPGRPGARRRAGAGAARATHPLSGAHCARGFDRGVHRGSFRLASTVGTQRHVSDGGLGGGLGGGSAHRPGQERRRQLREPCGSWRSDGRRGSQGPLALRAAVARTAGGVAATSTEAGSDDEPSTRTSQCQARGSLPSYIYIYFRLVS